jgi:hypothetical protein
MTQRAKAQAQQKAKLTPRDYRFHFFPWWGEPAYRIESGHVVITDKDREYFDKIEASEGCQLDEAQRRWYVATRDADFGGDPEKMWQEYPSTPDEAFQVSTEGTYYAVQLAKARKDGRISTVPHADGVPVNTFWDIGNSDGTAVWLHQKVGQTHRFIKFIEGWGEPYSYFVGEMQKLGYIWGTHYLPHDGQRWRMEAQATEAGKLHNPGRITMQDENQPVRPAADDAGRDAAHHPQRLMAPRHAIGDPVVITATVVGVHFTESKVHYAGPDRRQRGHRGLVRRRASAQGGLEWTTEPAADRSDPPPLHAPSG